MPKRGDLLYLGKKAKVQFRRVNTRLSFRYRVDPVPYIRKINWSFGDWYKTPQTTQERRWSFAYPEYVRAKRRNFNLPNAWDDYPRGDNNRKSWKRKKIKKQWMKNL